MFLIYQLIYYSMKIYNGSFDIEAKCIDKSAKNKNQRQPERYTNSILYTAMTLLVK